MASFSWSRLEWRRKSPLSSSPPQLTRARFQVSFLCVFGHLSPSKPHLALWKENTNILFLILFLRNEKMRLFEWEGRPARARLEKTTRSFSFPSLAIHFVMLFVVVSTSPVSRLCSRRQEMASHNHLCPLLLFLTLLPLPWRRHRKAQNYSWRDYLTSTSKPLLIWSLGDTTAGRWE